jgi:dienelactone hydrolase
MRRFAILVLFAFGVLGQERGRLTENVVTRADKGQSYTLFLPSTYDPAKDQPLLLVFDPRSRGTMAAEIFREAAEQFGWIIMSSNGTLSDSGVEPNERALRALLPDIKLYGVDPKRIYAAGFSGTAMVAWGLGLETRGLAGVIGVGGRLVDGLPPEKFPFASYGFSGETDFNNREMRAIDAILERAGKPHRFRQFPGDHRWIPADLAPDALGWFELLAMKNGKRTRDDALVARLFDRDVAAATAASPLDALRMFRAIAQTYDGLRDVSEARAAVARLERDGNVKRALDEEAKWDQYEERYVKEVLGTTGALYQELRQDEMRPVPAMISRGFRIGELKRHAAREGAEGWAAQRLLSSVYSQLAVHLYRQLMDKKEYALATVTLLAAMEIHDDRSTLWYNLGCAQARAGDRRHALDSLEKAISLGYKDAKHLETDEDYASLRENERFKSLVMGISQKP